MKRIPTKGRDPAELLDRMRALSADDADWRNGRTWSLVYNAGEEHIEFLKRAYGMFFTENALNPMAFKSLKRMEAEVVRMSATLLNGDAETVGSMTSGGTESILLACKAARDRADIARPEIVAPRTIHVAFEKAAHYFGMKIRYARVGSDKRVDVRAMRKLVGRSTVLIAASAPQYPHGVIDPIAELGVLARKRRIPFHVDACIGGFMLPWVEKLGRQVPLWDFRVPGVTSISADMHKYGYAAKGASVVIYRDMSYLRHQFFVATDWPGGIYASPSMPGTRPGGCIAAAWAALQVMGEDGYLSRAREALEATDALRRGLEAIPEVRVLGDPHMTIVSYAAADPAVDIYAVADRLEGSGWSVDRQQSPAALHCTVNANHLPLVEDYLNDLREAIAYVRAHPEAAQTGNAPMYGMLAKLPFRGMVRESVRSVMEGMYGPNAAAPDLAALGSGEDDGLLLKAARRYGGRVLGILDRIERVRERVSTL